MELVRVRRPSQRKAATAHIECAQCGERLTMPEWSETLDGARVRHLWTCYACGYAFETTVQYAIEVETAA